MIRIDKNVVETRGEKAQLLTEMTLGIKRLCMLMGREFVMPSLMSAIYCLKSDENEFKEFNLTEALNDFKNDTTATLKFIEQYASLEGNTPQEKFGKTLKEIEDEFNND